MSDQPRSSRPALPTDTGLVQNIIKQLRLAWRLLLDGRVPFVTKLVPLGTMLYILWPVDFMPDLLPGLGQLDDLATLALGIKLFIELAPPAIVQEHLREIEAVTTTWRIVEDEPHKGDGHVIEPPYQIDKGQS